VNDADASSLPALLLEITCVNDREEENFMLKIKPDVSLAGDLQPCRVADGTGAGNAGFQLTCNAGSTWQDGELSVPVSLTPGRPVTLRVLITFYDGEWVTAGRFRDIAELTAYCRTAWPALKDKTQTFSCAIPETGDGELDTFLRWYMIPGISLTKCTRNGEVVTMGYCELNQRDSYWTSWLHLVLFPELEKRMIGESAGWQQPSGKIPTTILPLIEREDDIDINAFFILRVARYFRFYHDRQTLGETWPAVRKAMDWLIGRDSNGGGLPVQRSFWGDWKDVRGVEDRMYSPFSGLIYLSALREAIFLSEACDDRDSHQRYEAAYQRGFDRINRPVEEGGLWNGRYYCQIWKDGTVNDRLLQDQTVGILFGVVPPERALSVVEALNENNLTAYGVCETWPYYPASFGYLPATYHNGAVWPWLSFVDCWARIRLGREREASDLILRVARADLVNSGDWSPNEHINSLTGENLGFRLQGWNAGLFGVVYFGLLNREILP
jgi:hypothetical protein